MYQIDYALRFTGKARTASADGNLLNVSMTAQSARVSSHIGDIGIKSWIEALPGDRAVFSSEVTFTSETEFQETGAITFGDGNTLHFSTVGNGYLAPCAEPGRRQGAVMWRIERGEGQFAGASGMITSNFFVSDQLAKEDYHCGVLLLP